VSGYFEYLKKYKEKLFLTLWQRFAAWSKCQYGMKDREEESKHM
jgi:hypothetical protein